MQIDWLPALTHTHVAILTIFAMGAITGLSRMSGFYLMSRITVTRRLETALFYLASSVLVAIVMPAVLKGDMAARAAIAASIAVMLATRKSALAMLTGLVVAIAWRGLLP